MILSPTRRIAIAMLLISWPLLSCSATRDENSALSARNTESAPEDTQKNALRYSHPKELAAEGYGLMYLSHRLAVNPCLHLNDSEKVDAETNKQAQEARNMWPKGTCEDGEVSAALTELLYAQHAALAASNDPVSVETSIRGSNQALRACLTPICVKDTAEKELPSFRAVLENPTRYGNAYSPDFVGTSLREVPVTKDILNKIQDLTKFCESASIDAGERMLNDVPVYVVSCFTGAPEYPTWVLRKHPLQLLLGLEQGSNLYVVNGSSAQGLPDLRNSIRVNAGEHAVKVYRFTAGRYQPILSMSFQATDDSELAF